MSDKAPAGILGTLRTPGGLTLQLTSDDALWAGRMLYGEEGTRASLEAYATILSVLMRRWAAINDDRIGRGLGVLWPTFTDLLKAYSQPLGAGAGPPPGREYIASLEWGQVPSLARVAILALFSGSMKLTQPSSGAVHFAARSFVRDKMASGRVPDWRLVETPAANAVVSDAQGRRLPRDPWVASDGDGPVGKATLVGLVLLVGAALLVLTASQVTA